MQFTNTRSGETVTTDLSLREIAEKFVEVARDNHFCWFWMVKAIQEASSASETRDLTEFVSDLFVIAVGRGLKSPMIRLCFKEYSRRYKIKLSKKGNVCLLGGNVHPDTSDPVGEEEYIGIWLGGKFLSSKFRSLSQADNEFLKNLGADPQGFFAKCSKDMDRCCYCGKQLEDIRSKEVGYGSTCASNWGLPWGGKAKKGQEVPSFASLWQDAKPDDRRAVRAICRAIRQQPEDDLNWMALRDVLMESGWPDERLPEKPKSGVLLPRG